jgi:hypothetical protein
LGSIPTAAVDQHSQFIEHSKTFAILEQRHNVPHYRFWSEIYMTTQLDTTTEQLWERWPALSRDRRLKEFRELHTGEGRFFPRTQLS